MPRNKRKHPHSRYERIMLACIDSLPFKFHSPGQPNIPKHYKKMDVNTQKSDRKYPVSRNELTKFRDEPLHVERHSVSRAQKLGKESMN